LALGADEEYVDAEKMPREMKEIAIKAAKVLDIQIAGVDILTDTQGKRWLLEANRGPGLTYDLQVSPELDSLASFFTRELKRTDDK